MKIKLFEQITNYSVDIFTSDEFVDFYQNKFDDSRGYPSYTPSYDLKDKIKYFSWDDLSNIFGSKKHNKSKIFVVAYNTTDILGVCFFAWFDGNNHYSMSYLSVNKEYYQQGVSKRLLEELFKYFSKSYPNDILYFSGYSIEGWKYLRKTILQLSEKYNVEIKEKAIEYDSGEWDEEKREMYKKSKKEIKNKYGKEWTDMLGYSVDESSYWEGRKREIFMIINNTKIGDILSEDIIYQYVQFLHNYDDFIDGDLGDRIEQFTKYKLQNVKLDDIDLDEFLLHEELAEEFAQEYKKTGYYPPIVLEDDYRIIDGNHRANGLKMIGKEYVKAFIGLKK